MSKIFKDELLNLFPDAAVCFDMDVDGILANRTKDANPDYATYNKKTISCFIEYRNLSTKDLIKDYMGMGWDVEGISVFEEKMNGIYDKKTIKYLMNLFFDIRLRFNTFHLDHPSKIYGKSKNGRFYCSIFCDKGQEKELRKVLKLIYDEYKLSLKEHDSPTNETFSEAVLYNPSKHYAIFSIGIVLFYFIINPAWFGYRKKLLIKRERGIFKIKG